MRSNPVKTPRALIAPRQKHPTTPQPECSLPRPAAKNQLPHNHHLINRITSLTPHTHTRTQAGTCIFTQHIHIHAQQHVSNNRRPHARAHHPAPRRRPRRSSRHVWYVFTPTMTNTKKNRRLSSHHNHNCSRFSLESFSK